MKDDGEYLHRLFCKYLQRVSLTNSHSSSNFFRDNNTDAFSCKKSIYHSNSFHFRSISPFFFRFHFSVKLREMKNEKRSKYEQTGEKTRE